MKSNDVFCLLEENKENKFVLGGLLKPFSRYSDDQLHLNLHRLLFHV